MARSRPLHQLSLSSSSPSDPTISQTHPQNHPNFHPRGRNVFSLLARREISPKTKYLPKRQWGDANKGSDHAFFGLKSEAGRDARSGLVSWVEAESLWHLSAKYCPLVPPPRSTIAAAFSPDGRTLASTHGDHTVKIIDCRTGKCLKVLSGHRRTPWVVRFHPIHPEILASGSLDHEVRLWDANTSECIKSRDFHRPIASIAFHSKGEFLAVASGHKLYIWHYDRKGESSSPTILLKTRRSLRAVHFHPHGAPFLLTAEVNDLDSSDSSMTRATSPGYLHYPPPAVFLANAQSSDSLSLAAEHSTMTLPFQYLPSVSGENSRLDSQQSNRPAGSSWVQGESSAPVQTQADLNTSEQHDYMETSPMIPSDSHATIVGTEINNIPNGIETSLYDPTVDAMETGEMQRRNPTNLDTFGVANSALQGVSLQLPSRLESIELGQPHQFLPSRDPTCWELPPFLQGWLLGQSQSGMPPVLPPGGGTYEHLSSYSSVDPANLTSDLFTHNNDTPVASAMAGSINLDIPGRSGLGHRFPRSRLISTPESGQGPPSSTPHDVTDAQPMISRIQSELATSLAAAAAAAELPCTVRLRIWPYDIRNACAPLSAEKCRLTIPHAVLCSEMGAHFSPCGRFLAACVACMLPRLEGDPGSHTQFHQDVMGAVATSPTRHPISAHQVMYELRIYSLEEATFGSVLVSRAIRAAHCLTSIQFSPTSEHILLAYGRRHGSLLKSIVIDGETALPIYTILEVYRVSDMEIVRVLPSAEDEVNVASFHPLAGGGLVYGTKEGKLRILQYDGSHVNSAGSSYSLDENMPEVQTYALEC